MLECSSDTIPRRTEPAVGARAVLEGGVLLLESSKELIPARQFNWIVRSLGKRSLLDAVDAVVVARPPTSSSESTHQSLH